MFSKELAVRCDLILHDGVDKELRALFEELIQKEYMQMKSNTPPQELQNAVVRIEILKKLQDYKQYLKDALGNGSQ